MTDTARAVTVELGADAVVVRGPNLAEQLAAALGNDQLSWCSTRSSGTW